MSKHTPGPWIADDAFMADDNQVRVGTPFKGGAVFESVTICECWYRDEADDETVPTVAVAEANARLIAAAPELLHALTRLLEAFEVARGLCLDRADFTRDNRLAGARAAIAKATGVQP